MALGVLQESNNILNSSLSGKEFRDELVLVIGEESDGVLELLSECGEEGSDSRDVISADSAGLLFS